MIALLPAPVLAVALLWHPRTFLASGETGMDAALLLLVATALAAWVLGEVLARTGAVGADRAGSRAAHGSRPIPFRAPLARRRGRVPLVVCLVLSVALAVVVVQKLADAAPLLLG